VRATDVDQIAEAIERVLAGNDLRESLIRRGQLQAAKFSWKSTAAEFLDLFKR
jgi:glycosyltransferase involved in cell wall biosynthesis